MASRSDAICADEPLHTSDALVPERIGLSSVSGAASERLAYGDIMRVLGVVAVVVQHVAQSGVRSLGEIPVVYWQVCNVTTSLTKWAVPVFVMLSGALLLDPTRQESSGVFFRRRFVRVGIPTIFWSAFFLLFAAAETKFTLPLSEMTDRLLSGNPYYHMHFMFLITGLYLFTPALRAFVRSSTDSDRTLVIAVSLLLAMFSQAIMIWQGYKPNALSLFVPYVGYYLAGYQIRNVKLSSRARRVAWLAGLGAVAVTAVGSSILCPRLGLSLQGRYFYTYFSPPVILMSFCAFILMADGFRRPVPGSPNRVLSHLANAALGVYLIHPIFFTIIVHFERIPLSRTRSPVAILVISAFLLAASYVGTIVMQRIPYLRRVLG
ncbi:MAG: acyltransferase family protein [Planctomycetota bacterium]|nr:acyltransferase family protein [Planctomycetota bacterium]